MNREQERLWLNPTGEPVSRLDDAKALQEAAEHVEMAGLAGAASLMRRCAKRLSRDDGAADPDTAFLRAAALPGTGRPT